MKFPYREVFIASPYDGFADAIGRPVVPISIRGPTGLTKAAKGLVDTGSDHTVFPESFADAVGINVVKSTGLPPKAAGGQRLPLSIGRGSLRIKQGKESVEWSDDLLFHDFGSADDELVILGHVGFLEFFTATFDGANGLLTLTHNRLSP